MRLLPSRKRYRCTSCGAQVLLKTSRRHDLKKTVAVIVGLTVALFATWFWSGYFEAAQDQREKRRLETVE